MGKIFTALALTALAVGPAAASDKADVMAVLHQWVEGFNKGGDMKSALSACADQAAIVDSIPPYAWHGAGACAKWLNDYDAFEKTNEVTEASGSLGKVRHIDITGDQAYVVAPMTLTYKVKGKPMKETGAIWTVALHKEASGWRITGWSYTEGAEAEVKGGTGG